MSLFECFRESTDEREISGSGGDGDKGGDDCGVATGLWAELKWPLFLLILDEKLVKK